MNEHPLLSAASLGSIAAGSEPCYVGPRSSYSILALRILELEAEKSVLLKKIARLEKCRKKRLIEEESS